MQGSTSGFRGSRGGRCRALVVTLQRLFGTLKGLCANSGAEHRTFYAAFTVAELGDLLPAGYPSGQDTRSRETVEFLQYPHYVHCLHGVGWADWTLAGPSDSQAIRIRSAPDTHEATQVL
jgi:hypothetical protein